ncbi:MAG: endolytic transglycosylase MltG [Sphingopyxis granuli]|uniref:endolytic transglycosylase MltG n=1 Tax=unclassified Sphingopyxis TaxID=2614943 RepID=UPI00086E0533|nr:MULTISPECIES: endolytic transglycosylase MltG [unclassified Sphingopyxis]AVA13275.1 endolytic transglycosylase MltG [Sphingopyxis sp. MG]ODU30227.1 MAG: aminodeoxychorismate lyase [Sphingopyxis sp. SCN 67-31]
MRPFRWLTIAIFALLLAACSGGAPRDTVVVIPPGASIAKAGEILEKAGVASASAFRNRARFLGSDKPIKPGEYEVKKGMGAGDILALLQSGKTVQRFVMIPEGMPSIMVWERLMAEPRLTGEVAVPAEGSVLPDTYAFTTGESRAAVLKRMQAAMDKAFAELWAKRTPRTAAKDRGEAITLASIVEKETGVPAERRTVAGVYTNRLAVGMKLQADPTIIYPITRGKPLGRRILRSEIQAVNGYNTYAMVGLPKGPIANPGKASIAAVLDPEPNDYLFFVAKGDGGHIFARTLSEHNANVQKWYEIRRERGEM